MSEQITTMDDKGREYVATWPDRVSRRYWISSAYVGDAMVRAGVLTKEANTSDLHLRFLRDEYTAEIGALTPEQAKEVIAKMREIRRELDENARTCCHFCGMPLENGTCHQCGDPID
ncbi:hypothetical protein ACWDTT_15815 [Streptosporangium sandarakinum]